jgi:hypothetical protein
MGEVAFVICPNKMHEHAIGQFAQAYPQARVFVPSGLPEVQPDLRYDRFLNNTPEPEWSGEIDQVLLKGNSYFTEALFLHRASRSLIVTDFIENISKKDIGPLGVLVLRIVGGYGRPVASPEHRFFLTCPSQLRESLKKVEAWNFNQILLAHGKRIEADAKSVFQKVAEELIGGALRRGPLARALFRVLVRCS